MVAVSTRERILDSAEKLFSEKGFDATSLRSITTGARVNLAAVNYHFGSKDALIREVFARRLGPLNEERLRLLAEAGDDPDLEQVVEAFVGPALRMSRVPRGAMFMRLFGYAMSRRDDRILTMFTERFREVVERFTAALGGALPDLDGDEVFWRLLFMVGAMAHTMALSDKLSDLSGGRCDGSDVELTLRQLVPFLVAGMRAPSPRVDGGGGS